MPKGSVWSEADMCAVIGQMTCISACSASSTDLDNCQEPTTDTNGCSHGDSHMTIGTRSA
jgi:hypothetical protein